jgi:hypothetical protein
MPPALNALVMMVASVSLFNDVTVSLFTRKISGESGRNSKPPTTLQNKNKFHISKCHVLFQELGPPDKSSDISMFQLYRAKGKILAIIVKFRQNL